METDNASEVIAPENQADAYPGPGDAIKAEHKSDFSLLKDEPIPLLLEDSTLQTLPRYVEKMFENVDTYNMTQNDLLAVLVFCIALESGFLPAHKDLRNFVVYWGFTFNSGNVYEVAKNKLPNGYCEVRDTVYKFYVRQLNYIPEKCLLFCVRTGDSFCITLTPENLPGRSILLSTSRYVLPSPLKNVAARFRNLNEFSFLLKQKLFVPIRNRLLEENHFYYPGLGGMPSEILAEISQYLTHRDICKLRQTCTRLYKLLED